MDALKTAGNDAVRQGNFAAAIDFYQRAIAAADPSMGDELAALHSNCSFAHLKLNQPQEALFHATQAISFKSNWSKGHFRLGEAQFALRDYPSAEKAYAKASELSPEDATIKKRLTLSREAMSGFYFRQLLAGRDFCINPTNIIEKQIFSSAQQMKNFVYLVGDAKTREAVVVDAAWDVKGIRAALAADNMNLVGAVVTHYHFDHTGGTPPPPFDQFGIKVPGIRELAIEDKVPVYINKHDAETVKHQNGVPTECMTLLEDSAVVSIGSVKLQFIHTPGHTPGSQCIHIQGNEDILMSGDTLFIGSCGRLDLPDCDAKAMYTSLQKKLASLPSNTRVYPGHDYGGPFTTISHEKKQGFLKPVAEKEWLRMHRL
ncbi:hypothetical protein CY35_04G095200 [Sphagnum magellanicum]|nr:hypothetical protein CY35_04G095200 [Sphagnum magellanicum]KAH9565780.1 hypothetical protein CY35_04G095200 [Sphagnum magellanicum]KAH9565781.1 hypothetical protein CY35_04G095200 [Sphagnum magellanicum]KAH9565786.1 hypothetical protein CY35_04G095200 [Sphagnum magellanicum]